jgi:hypothetical protein
MYKKYILSINPQNSPLFYADEKRGGGTQKDNVEV